MTVTRKTFGTGEEGEEVYLYTLKNRNGLEVSITNYGGTITSIMAPDRTGVFGDVVLGYETLDEYIRNPRYFGTLIGRFANRIANGKFWLNGVEYQLAQNNNQNHLHGGVKGFDKRVWKSVTTDTGLQLEYFSPDGEENYPGNLSVAVEYSLNDENALRIDYHASTDQDTIVNLTNHSYFNLAGQGTILDHELMLRARSFTPVADDLIPTGEIRAVEGTPMDFRTARVIGNGGYDHNFVLDDWKHGSIRSVARVREPNSGRVMEVFTTQPGIQFYSGNFLDGSLVGKHGVRYEKYAALCLETQHYPDSPNHPNFPSTVLRAGESYDESTIYKFTTD
ncbi:MAG TPA: aldose epimerase family protein [Pyrinomonadaceae bacterium]|nr:aldose epimerase family protein [Pyrinomonadaceae bacterium]